MPETLTEVFRRHSRPLEPIPTDQVPILPALGGVKAVLFDVYGTLLVSGAGEVGTASAPGGDSAAAFQAALQAVGVALRGPAGQGVQCLFETIEASHAASRQAGIDFPEVEICAIWQQVLDHLAAEGLVELPASGPVDLRRLAVEHEARANPCWPMPGLGECLEGLQRGGLRLGIISNAQFYTPLLFEALLGESLEGLGVAPQLQFYSYRLGRAKPGPALFRAAVEALQRDAIAPGEVLSVGNDMLNDVLPAQMLGFHTALFAGDRRSLRWRRDDRRLAGVTAELVLTELGQIADALHRAPVDR